MTRVSACLNKLQEKFFSLRIRLFVSEILKNIRSVGAEFWGSYAEMRRPLRFRMSNFYLGERSQHEKYVFSALGCFDATCEEAFAYTLED